MKIKSIALTNFRNHHQTKIADLGRVNYFLGLNGHGKSSILDAVQYALTGVCRGVDEGGRGADALKSQIAGGPKSAAQVHLLTDRGDVIRGVGQGPKSQAHMAIRQRLGIDERFLRVAAAPTNLLALDRKKQEEVFFALAGGVVSQGAIEAALLEAGVTGDLGEIAERIATAAGRENYLTYLKEHRPALKREIASQVVPQTPGLPNVSVSGRQALEKSAMELNSEINKRKGENQAIQSKRQYIEEQIKRQEARLVAPSADRSAILSSEVLEDLRRLLVRRGELKILHDAADMARAVAATEQIAIKKTGEKTKTLGPRCETCGQAIPEEYSKKVLSDLTNMWKLASAKEKAARIEVDRLLKEMLAINEQEILEKINRSERAVQQIAVIDSAAAGVQQSLDQLRADLAALPTTSQDWLQLDANLKAICDKIKELTLAEQEANRAEAINRKRTALEDELKGVEQLIEVIGPGGPIWTLMASGGSAALVAKVQEYGARLGVGQINVDLSPWLINLNGRPIELASASEQWRVAAAFGIAFAVQAGVSFVCLDAAEILRGENQDRLMALVMDSGLDQIFVAGAVDELPVECLEGANIYTVSANENGVASVTMLRQVAAV